VMEQAGRGYGIRPAAVVIEFVFGATESLDTYSAFVPEVAGRKPGASAKSNTCDASTTMEIGEPLQTCQSAGLEDSLVGIGVEIKPHARGVEVIKSLTGGPAQLAGLRAGDVIVAINNQELVSRPVSHAVELISGVAGSSLTLRIERENRNSTLTLRRARVEVRSVSEVRLVGSADKVGYIKLEKFAQKSDEEMDRALWSLHQQGMRALVIDLRGNPGGLLTTAISLTDKFLPGGVIVSTRGRNKVDSTMTYAKKEQTWKIPLVVLIDENSASASEIFAAAIQENGRGMVVGRRSYGKGTVQTHFPLKSVPGNLRLTTAQFYSPKGRVMAGTGVEPDIRVDSVAGLLRGAGPSDRDLAMALEVARSRELFELPIANTQRGAEATPPIPRS